MTYMKMVPESKVAWLTALRSGQYNQVRGFLHALGEDEGYCCLGVACEKAIEDGVVLIREPFTPSDGDQFEKFGDHSGTTPYKVREWMFGPRWNSIAAEDTLQHLMSMNDNDRASFDEIAAWIEAEL